MLNNIKTINYKNNDDEINNIVDKINSSYSTVNSLIEEYKSNESINIKKNQNEIYDDIEN